MPHFSTRFFSTGMSICCHGIRTKRMICYYCGGDTSVTNSRPQKRSNKVWRRRRCDNCQNIVSTLEAVDYEASLSFASLTGHLEPFQRDKLFVSVLDSLKHRKTAVADATALTDAATAKLMVCMDSSGAIDRDSLTFQVQLLLHRFDPAAGVQYAAFHPVKR
jgi:transcriptional regulator NrdR family protein